MPRRPVVPLTEKQRLARDRMIAADAKMSDQQIRDEMIANGENPTAVAKHVSDSLKSVVDTFLALQNAKKKD